MRGGLPPPDVVLTGQFDPGQERRPRHVPFTVPAATRQIHLRYDYSDRVSSDPSQTGNTLDLGLFDERGIAPGSPGFRGWSGSARSELTIDERWATPPYRAGLPGAGTWHLLLGPYKVGARGLDYRVELWFNPGLAPEDVAPAVLPPVFPARRTAAAEPGWARGDLHCHTRHSDGDSWPAEVLAAAALEGLDFLGITDHNSPALMGEVVPRGDGFPLFVPGIEVTTYGGHWNAWGVPGWFEFRDVSRAGTAAAMAAAVEAGAFVSVNHPKPLGPGWSFGEGLGYHAVEVWNGPWLHLNALALAWWDEQLRRGERLVAVGGSDTHRLRAAPTGPFEAPRLGRPTTWVRVDGPLTVESVLAAPREGRCFVSATPAGPELYLERAGDGVRVRVVGARGAALLLVGARGCLAAEAVAADDQEWRYHLAPDAPYARAQVVDGMGNVLAVSNPVWSA